MHGSFVVTDSCCAKQRRQRALKTLTIMKRRLSLRLDHDAAEGCESGYHV